MISWLYQMSVKDLRYNWSHEQYWADVCEGKVTKDWEVGTVRPKDYEPEEGDEIVLFYVPSADKKPGVYGLGDVKRYDEDGKTIDFEPKAPSDRLKMNPMWDEEVKDIIHKIRGKVSRGNMWVIPTDLLTQLKEMIARHMGVVFKPLSP
ncbi:MAG: hypothetical protein HY663_06500 [Chloroflexi bacterium]|nr:hypothetical protein [Chloroflexota bacterium]